MRGKHADSQPKAKEILNKLGITNHAAMMNILSGGQKLAPQPLPTGFGFQRPVDCFS